MLRLVAMLIVPALLLLARDIGSRARQRSPTMGGQAGHRLGQRRIAGPVSECWSKMATK
jgi:hypothetical protein